MRVAVLIFLATLGFAAPAAAQTSITLDARRGAPVVEAEINRQPVRLEIDLRMPDLLAMSTSAAERLEVRRLPLANAVVRIDGGGAMRGRIARPRISFGERASRAFAGVFPAPVSTAAEGVVGPGALPYEVITIVLAEAPANVREITFALDDADVWRAQVQVGGETVNVLFDVTNEASVFNRPAARTFDHSGAIVASGEVSERQLILGLSTMMQPITTELAIEGIALAPAFARTNAPLLGVTEEDALVVEAEGEAPPPAIVIGRAALLRAGCASISVDRRTQRLTLRCAGD